MIIKLDGETYTFKDGPTMRFYKALADAGKQPDEPLAMPDYMRWFVAAFLGLKPESLLDTRPDELLAAFRAIQDAQGSAPFDASPAQAGAEVAPDSPPTSTPSPTP